MKVPLLSTSFVIVVAVTTFLRFIKKYFRWFIPQREDRWRYRRRFEVHVHLDNVPFDFGIPLSPDDFRYDAADRNVSLFVMAVYVNFARTGDPIPQPVSGVTWSGYNSSHRAYLRVDPNPKMASTFYPLRMAFWNHYHPKLVQLKFETKIVVTFTCSKRRATICATWPSFSLTCALLFIT